MPIFVCENELQTTVPKDLLISGKTNLIMTITLLDGGPRRLGGY